MKQTLAGTSTSWTIGRPTCVYGPERKSWTLTPLGFLRKGTPIMLGADGGVGRMNAVFIDDVVTGILAAGACESAASQVFYLGPRRIEFYGVLYPVGRNGGASSAVGFTGETEADRADGTQGFESGGPCGGVGPRSRVGAAHVQ